MRTLIALVCILGLVSGLGNAQAGPVQSELKSYRCLVADFLVSSGGSSPAISPDGTVLVYQTQQPDDFENDKVWVLTDADRQLSQEASGTPVQPWELNVNALYYVPMHDSSPMKGYRNVDWSPDGQRVVFTCHGSLYAADLADLRAKKTNAKKISDAIRDGGDYQPIVAPRWSSDGTRVVFLVPSNGPTPLSSIYVVDIATGEKKVVAQDAVPAPMVWEQPWSPDGKSIVYSSMKAPELINAAQTYSVTFGGISVVSAGGGGGSRIVDEQTTFYPSWSPKGNRMAYAGPAKSEGLGLGGLTTVIYVCDANGKNPIVIGAPVFAKETLAAIRGEVRNNLVKMLKTDYPGIFTDVQLQALSKLQITDADVIQALGLAQSRLAGELAGGEYLWRVKAAMKQLKPDMKNLNDAAMVAKRAVRDLPEDKRQAIDQAINTRLLDVMRPLVKLHTSADKAPVWSPDGKRIAFIRSDPTLGKTQLMVADVATRKATAVFESSAIETITWTRDGKLLLLQAKRSLAHTQLNTADVSVTDFLTSQWLESVTTAGYPEIWLIEPK